MAFVLEKSNFQINVYVKNPLSFFGGLTNLVISTPYSNKIHVIRNLKTEVVTIL